VAVELAVRMMYALNPIDQFFSSWIFFLSCLGGSSYTASEGAQWRRERIDTTIVVKISSNTDGASEVAIDPDSDASTTIASLSPTV
jgi:hypothetical protein